MKSLLGLVFSLIVTALPTNSFGQEKKGFDANEVIFGHVMDAHEFHFFSYKGDDGKLHHATIPLPVILYSKEKGFTSFMSFKFHYG